MSIAKQVQMDLMRGKLDLARATVLAILRHGYATVREIADALRGVGVMFQDAYWLIFGREVRRGA